MTPALWIQLLLGLISAAAQTAKNGGVAALPADIDAAKEQLHALVDSLIPTAADVAESKQRLDAVLAALGA